MSYLATTVYYSEVRKGRVPGHSMHFVVGRNRSVSDTSLQDVWGGSGNIVLPTAAESWEIVSSSANDAAAGTGARTVTINTLDANYDAQSPVTVTLNGTTAVAISGTHFRAHEFGAGGGAFVASVGTVRGSNEGDLTIRVSGGGATRMVIPAGVGANEDSIVTVPNGFTAYGVQLVYGWEKNQDGRFVSSTLSGASQPAIQAGALPAYQAQNGFQFLGGFPNPEMSDFIFQAQGSAPGYDFTIIEEFELVDNNYLP